jgi:hypothetical protein
MLRSILEDKESLRPRDLGSDDAPGSLDAHYYNERQRFREPKTISTTHIEYNLPMRSCGQAVGMTHFDLTRLVWANRAAGPWEQSKSKPT